jgi:phage shock protein PspC (stress-responsive transcriptional regulator)
MEAAAPTSLIGRDDTFLGICQAIGEDFGFNPIWLRILFALPVMFVPTATVAAYLGLGVVVLISRLLAPRPKRSVPVQAVETVETPRAEAPAQVALAEADADQFALPMAA